MNKRSQGEPHDLCGDVSSHAATNVEPSAACLADLRALAVRFLARSNEKGVPQWDRKAHAHAYGGVVHAISVFEKHFAPDAPRSGVTATDAELGPGST